MHQSAKKLNVAGAFISVYDDGTMPRFSLIMNVKVQDKINLLFFHYSL